MEKQEILSQTQGVHDTLLTQSRRSRSETSLRTPNKVIVYKTEDESAYMTITEDDEFIFWNNVKDPKRVRQYFKVRQEKTYKEIKKDFPETLEPSLDETEIFLKIRAIYKHLG